MYNLSYVSDENISEHFCDFFFAQIHVITIHIYIYFYDKSFLKETKYRILFNVS